MRHVKLLSFDEFSSRRGLLEQPPYAEGSWGWFKTLASTTLTDREKPVFAAAFDEAGEVRAVLPLAVTADRSLRSLAAPYTTRYAPALHDLDWARYLGEQAASYVANSMRLDALDLEDKGIKAYFAGLNQSGLGQATFGHFSNWCDTIDDFSSYWESRPARLRATVQRKLRAIRKEHDISFQLAKDPGELCQALKDYLRIYAASWKEPEPHPDFIPTLVHELGLENSLRLGTLSINGVVAAAQIWLEKGSQLTIFKLAHRKEFASHSPGTILTHWLLQSLCTPGCAWKVDFGRGDDAYKRDWLKNCRMRHGLVVANWRSSRGLMTLLCEVCPTRVANIWKKVPLLPDQIEDHSNVAAGNLPCQSLRRSMCSVMNGFVPL